MATAARALQNPYWHMAAPASRQPRANLSVVRAERALPFGDLPSMVGRRGTGCTPLWSQLVWPVADARRSMKCRTILLFPAIRGAMARQEGRDTRRLRLREWGGLGGPRREIESGVRRVLAATMAYHGLCARWREAGEPAPLALSVCGWVAGCVAGSVGGWAGGLGDELLSVTAGASKATPVKRSFMRRPARPRDEPDQWVDPNQNLAECAPNLVEAQPRVGGTRLSNGTNPNDNWSKPWADPTKRWRNHARGWSNSTGPSSAPRRTQPECGPSPSKRW